MAGPDVSLEPDEEKPLDPAAERVRRKLLRFMAINLGILFTAVMAVVLAFVYKSLTDTRPEPVSNAAPAVPSGEMLSGEIPLPRGTRVISHSASGNRLTLHVVLEDGGEEILLYDIPERRLVGRFAIAREIQ